MKNLILSLLMVWFIQSFTHAQSKYQHSVGFSSGYNYGIGGKFSFTIHDFLKDSHTHIRLGMGYTALNPGNAADARRIFINNATNGTPEKKGHFFDIDLNFMMPVKSEENLYLLVGPSFSAFKGNFKYIGGNEDFDIKSTQWGLGIGALKSFKISTVLDFELQAGLSYYLPSTLTGHDTSYSPDDENVNPRTDNQNNDALFTYKDADQSINQPRIIPKLMIGVNYKL